MKPGFAELFLGVLLVSATQARSATLPDTCGNEKAIIDVTTHKDHPAPALPESAKARVVFIEVADKNALPVITRVGLDGAWVGANKGNSWFESTVLPGEHHVCVDWQLAHRYLKDKAALEVFTAAAGKTHYFMVKVGWTQNVNPVQFTRYDGEMTLELSAVNEDEGKYMAQNSNFSVAKPK